MRSEEGAEGLECVAWSRVVRRAADGRIAPSGLAIRFSDPRSRCASVVSRPLRNSFGRRKLEMRTQGASCCTRRSVRPARLARPQRLRSSYGRAGAAWWHRARARARVNWILSSMVVPVVVGEPGHNGFSVSGNLRPDIFEIVKISPSIRGERMKGFNALS